MINEACAVNEGSVYSYIIISGISKDNEHKIENRKRFYRKNTS